ncbi:MAG TPA: hypothetical protein VMR59_01930 [Patescibacteria group bacterium]|jgi:hypothetical protein|nr:hypothetical protein [Patescibacteria group bacterium]
MDKAGMFGELLEQGQQTVQNTVKSAVSDVAGSVTSQLGVKPEASPDNQGKTQSQNQNQTQNTPKVEPSILKAASSPETIDLVKEFYAPSQDVPPDSAQVKQQEQMETQQKLAKLRQELHQGEYYEPLIAYETKKPGREEEGAAEKVEREEKEEEQKKMELEEKKAKEKQDISTSRAQRAVEANRGVAG